MALNVVPTPSVNTDNPYNVPAFAAAVIRRDASLETKLNAVPDTKEVTAKVMPEKFLL